MSDEQKDAKFIQLDKCKKILESKVKDAIEEFGNNTGLTVRELKAPHVMGGLSGKRIERIDTSISL